MQKPIPMKLLKGKKVNVYRGSILSFNINYLSALFKIKNMGIIIYLYHQGRIIEKQLISDAPYINKYVVREEREGKTLSFLDERTDLKVGDYVYVYLAEPTGRDTLPRTIIVKRPVK